MIVSVLSLANFVFLIYPHSQVSKYPPLAFATELNHDWPNGTVIFYAKHSSDGSLVRYFNPASRWRQVSSESVEFLEKELIEVYDTGGTAWFDTTLIDRFDSTQEGLQWLQAHTRRESMRELNNGTYRIRFVQILPQLAKEAP
jgi:hypothetical protein